MLIRGAELLDATVADVRVVARRIEAVGALAPMEGEAVVEAAGALLLPGLHDHHLHLAATAMARASIHCGPPDVRDGAQLAQALSRPGSGWLRGIGYHDSVAGMIDRAWIDVVVPDRPVRIQHRSGRLWIVNSAGLDRLLASGLPAPPSLDAASGHLFDDDGWLRRAMGGEPPALAGLGANFAKFGVTGVTEMGPGNGPGEALWLRSEQRSGSLPQRVLLAGRADLSAAWDDRLMLGPVKVHLHEAHLPPHDELIETIASAHSSGRPVAVHCVTEAELVYTLSAFAEAGCRPDDRIEHASVAPDALVEQMARLGLCAAVQPHFIFERGDGYRRDIAPSDWDMLYRLRAFIDAGVPLAGSSDAPYSGIDPWASMRSAMERRTRDGEGLGRAEALTPEQALALYLADPRDFRRVRKVERGAPADLCLLRLPWREARNALSAHLVRMTMIDGCIVHDLVDQAPAQGRPGVDPAA